MSENMGKKRNRCTGRGCRGLKGPTWIVLLAVVMSHISVLGEVESTWKSIRVEEGESLYSERVDNWRNERMWHMLTAEDGYLLAGFEERPGIHPWQGEHVGKWLHAATLAQQQTGDKKLLKALARVAERLIATQDESGYIGTYGPDYTFMAMPENKQLADVVDDVPEVSIKKGRKPRGGWDTWTLRYNLYGLLVYEHFHPNEEIVDACRSMGDLLMEVYGKGKYDLTKYGTREGISATTLLESIMMLYERTRDPKYLEFAEHIVVMSEGHSRLRLMGTMLENGSVVYPGDGKAYQLMANLLGYLRLYQATGKTVYLETVLNGWEQIRKEHTNVTGGPWSMKKDYNGNRECFAHPEDFDPYEADVETCSTTTWIQLNLHLLEHTGEAKYAIEAERSLFNALIGAQYKEGLDWSYYTKCNHDSQPFEERISCCASSGPRALEMFSQYLVGEANEGITIASLVPSSIDLPEKYGSAEVRIHGNYPVEPRAKIAFEKASGKRFALNFREPEGAILQSVTINGEKIRPEESDTGFYQLKRKWKTGDKIEVSFKYLVRSHIELPETGKKWVAFSYGPWALSRKWSKGTDATEPFLGKSLSESELLSTVELAASGKDGLPELRIKGSSIKLELYFATVGHESGAQTYFQF